MTDEDEEFNRIEREAKQRMEAVSAALNKKAENARELGLDYEPAQQDPVGSFKVEYEYPTAQRTWVGLSPADRGKCLSAGDAHGWIGVMEATEARLKELNT